MEREHVNAIISLARNKDWELLMDYIKIAVSECEHSLAYMDCTKSTEIARLQGARMALANMLNLEEVAHGHNETEEQA